MHLGPMYSTAYNNFILPSRCQDKCMFILLEAYISPSSLPFNQGSKDDIQVETLSKKKFVLPGSPSLAPYYIIFPHRWMFYSRD